MTVELLNEDCMLTMSQADVSDLIVRRGEQNALTVLKIVERKTFQKSGETTIGGASI